MDYFVGVLAKLQVEVPVLRSVEANLKDHRVIRAVMEARSQAKCGKQSPGASVALISSVLNSINCLPEMLIRGQMVESSCRLSCMHFALHPPRNRAVAVTGEAFKVGALVAWPRRNQ